MSKRKKKGKGKPKGQPPAPPVRYVCQKPGCGYDMHPGLVLAQEMIRRLEAAAFGVAYPPLLVVCPGCNDLHYLTADLTAVRQLTPAERFRLEVEVPRALASIAAGDLTKLDDGRGVVGDIYPEP